VVVVHFLGHALAFTGFAPHFVSTPPVFTFASFFTKRPQVNLLILLPMSASNLFPLFFFWALSSEPFFRHVCQTFFAIPSFHLASFPLGVFDRPGPRGTGLQGFAVFFFFFRPDDVLHPLRFSRFSPFLTNVLPLCVSSLGVRLPPFFSPCFFTPPLPDCGPCFPPSEPGPTLG